MSAFRTRLILFLAGGMLYCLIEILFRGFTHWSMGITGGVCMVFLYEIMTKTNLSMWVQCLLGSAIITFFEYGVGVFVNLYMHWNVWDYSDMPLNIQGQICVPFMIIWYLICIPARYISIFLERNLFSKRFITFRKQSYPTN